MKLNIPLTSWLASIILLASCHSELAEPEALTRQADTEFHLNLNAQTRAPQTLDTDVYNAKVYMFTESTAGSERFDYLGEADITGGTFTAERLQAGVRYRFVFMALPKDQIPALPLHTDAQPDYEVADLAYIESNETGHEIFRAILDFSPKNSQTNSYDVVLTRQNGALQVRMSNADGALKSVKLEVEGMPEMYLHDGTGGKVITKGTAIQLSKEDNLRITTDYRITVNLLPAEDVTGKGKLTLTYTNGSQKEYNLKSTQGGIPIFPNQITWLTLSGTGGEGNFNVNFGPDINLDDDKWDGIHN
ncbi:hypothetical protein [Alistipes onderdonkii]|uniref:hypothetical protein n=1 Tax=Alistipes onderdonkii TaxID=328813 RepID=UPI0036F3C81A